MRQRATRFGVAGAAGLLLAGGVATPALAATGITAATGGTAMVATNAGPTGTFTSLGSITVNEGNSAEISTGRFSIMAPAGFEFRTSAAVNLSFSSPGSSSQRLSVSASASCTGASRTSLAITPTASAITFYVCATSTNDTTFSLSNIAVRPSASTPVASGNMYLDGSTGAVTVAGVTRGVGGTNFGTLVENPGPTTQLGVAVPASVTAGTTQTATVTSKDAFGNTTPAYRGAVKFTSTDPSATLPADYTFTAADNGVHPFPTLVLKTAGARSVTVTDKATASIAGAGSTTVVAAAASTMTLAGIGNPFTAGAAGSPVVTLKDVYGNVATGYTGTVAFTSTDAAASLPANYTFTGADAGTHTFTGGVTLRTAGNQSVTASDGTRSATQTPITVQPGTLHHLVLSPATSAIDAGMSRTYTAQGRDSSNNNLGDVTGTTTFSVTPDGSCTGAVCTATVAGAHTVTGTKSGATGTASLTVNPAAPHVSVSLSQPSIVANGTATSTVQIQVTDTYGNPRAGDTVTVATDGGATLSAVQNLGNGNYSATVTASTVAGTQTITATDGSATGSTVLTQDAGPASVVSLALSAATVQADGTTTVGATITVADSFGNPRTGDPVTLTTDGDVTISAVTSQGFGTYTATVTASTTAGTETLTATDGAATATASLVELAPLAIGSVSPDSRGQGANGGAFGQTVTITGNGFTAGAQADFGAGVTVKFTTFVDSAHLAAHVVVAGGAALGARPVTVSLVDGRSVSGGSFTVNAGPTVSDVTPNAIGPGAQRTMVITGANFATGMKVTVPASGVAVTAATVLDSTHLSVDFSTAGVAVPGPRDLIITNPADAGSTVCAGCFAVTAAPIVTDITPGVLGGGALTTVTVTGSNFTEGARVSFAGSGVGVIAQSRVDDGTIVATVSVAGAATPGARTVSVINGDGGKGSIATAFAVSAAPTVTGITPASLGRGGSATVTITGTNFAPGATVSLSTGVTVTDVVVVDANTITATVAVSATTGLGTRTVLVTNADFGKGACAGCFRVA